MSNRRVEAYRHGHELPTRRSTSRSPEASARRADHDVDFFHDVAILRYHLKPVFRFLCARVGRRWVEVAPEVERRCRESRCPPHLRGELFLAVRQQLGLELTFRMVLPCPVRVDPATDLLFVAKRSRKSFG